MSTPNGSLSIDTMIRILEETKRAQSAGGLVDPLAGFGSPLGSNGLTFKRYRQLVREGAIKSVRLKGAGGFLESFKARSITPNTETLYGCTGLFNLCGPDDIIGLTMQDDALVMWLGFFEDRYCERFIKMLTYMDQQGTGAGSVTGTVYGSPCDDPPTSEKGTCEIVIGDFGYLRGCGEGVDVGKIGERKCDKQPTYTLPIEGVGPVRIDNDLDLETLAAAQLVKHELSRLLITGDANTAYQFDGLSQLVNDGYITTQQVACPALDSVVVDWQSDDLDGAVNGHGNIVWKVRDMWRRIRWRIQQSGLGMPAEGDVVLVMPTWLAWAFLDAWAYASIYTGVQYNEVFRDNLALREFRERHANGLFGNGYITIDGFNIHIIGHDWLPITQDAPNFCGDIYFLTRRLGARRVLFGQYMPLNLGAQAVASQAGFPYYKAQSMQGGRALRWMEFDNACVQPCLMLRPRVWLETPWAQGVINNVCVSQQFNPMSSDPQSSYWVGEDPNVAEAITQYWYDDEGWFH
jgi:hypothetical protein